MENANDIQGDVLLVELCFILLELSVSQKSVKGTSSRVDEYESEMRQVVR